MVGLFGCGRRHLICFHWGSAILLPSISLFTGEPGPQQHGPVAGILTKDPLRVAALHPGADPMGLLCLFVIYSCGWNFKQTLGSSCAQVSFPRELLHGSVERRNRFGHPSPWLPSPQVLPLARDIAMHISPLFYEIRVRWLPSQL